MSFTPTRDAGLARLSAFLPRAGRAYADTRNHDTGANDGIGRDNVSQLSPWLHVGLLDEAELLDAVLGGHTLSAAEKFTSEVFWRLYFKGYLEQRPSIWDAYCDGRDTAFDLLEKNSGRCTAYEQAIAGKTGIAAFDIWARELVRDGYLHNHARMWFASIWMFTLKIDWHLGADFFLQHLVDGDAASNTLSWRWVAGLHTKGKTYLAREDNIARFTENRPDGPLKAEGLAQDGPALTEERDHPRIALDLPEVPNPTDFSEPYALLLHDEAASHVPLNLASPPSLIIGAARPEARSPRVIGEQARKFSNDAVANGICEAGIAFGCNVISCDKDLPLADIMSDAGLSRLALPYLPKSWTREALLPHIEGAVAVDDRITLVRELDRATWPLAKAGFFGVKKKISSILDECAIHGAALSAAR
ncbi:MAG: FAD-binding domain-containing protein [Erythrobacter sp.]